MGGVSNPASQLGEAGIAGDRMGGGKSKPDCGGDSRLIFTRASRLL